MRKYLTLIIALLVGMMGASGNGYADSERQYKRHRPSIQREHRPGFAARPRHTERQAQHRHPQRPGLERRHRPEPRRHYRGPRFKPVQIHHHRPGHRIRMLPRGYLRLVLGPVHYFYHAGVFYRPDPAGYVVVQAPLGVVVPVLPAGYRIVLGLDNRDYYAVGDTYFVKVANGYQVITNPVGVLPPDGDNTGSAPSVDTLYIYPGQGQSEAQQARDRYECHQWGVQQTGYDPVQGGTDKALRNHYHRAMTACLEARGYTVK